MLDSDIINSNKDISNVNSQNESKRLQEKISEYNSVTRNNAANNRARLSQSNAPFNNINKSNSIKQNLQKKVGSSALQSVGVPKPFADKLIDVVQAHKNKNLFRNSKFGALSKGLLNKGNSEREELQKNDSPQEGLVNFKVSLKFIKYSLIASVPIFTIIIFCCLFISASQTYLNAISMGHADSLDSLSSAEADDEINKKGTDGLDDEITDEDIYGIYIGDIKSSVIRDNKLQNINIIQVSDKSYIKNKYNEADLSELEDFYPSVEYLSEEYQVNVVYDFFFKMYNLHNIYKGKYGVELDLPLLMATLNMQSSDKNVVFKSNLDSRYRTNDVKDIPLEELDYYYNWSSYTPSENNSEHDMEVLAQNMVSEKPLEQCETPASDGKCYVIDDEKYREFLKEFLEEKYYLGNSSISETSICSAYTEFIKYDLTEDQLLQIASLAQQEQGTAKGAAAEASLMANLFELKGSKYGSGAEGLYNYVRNSGWFANAAQFMDGRAARANVVEAVRSVLIDGKRTLPGYINEHDYLGDIISVTNFGSEISKTDKTLYTQFRTVIKNAMGSTYTFYSYPDTNSDPFGYTSEAVRKQKGEFHYDFDTGNPVYCVGTTLSTNPASGDYRNWTQCGQSWSNKIVPNSSSTMCQIGCLITSISKQIARSGTAITTDWIDPGVAVDNFTFASGGNLYWHSVKNLAPNFHYHGDINLIGMSRQAIAEKLSSYDPERYYIILAVSAKDKDRVHHYVAMDYIDLSNSKIYIMDTSIAPHPDLYETYKVYRAHIYVKKD